MGFPLRVGIGTGNRLPFPELARQWQQIENAGFDTAWVVDHFMASDNELTPYYEAWTLIAALGALTSRIRFGILVAGNTYRNPGLLAKEALTIDHATNGRVEIGIGAGWMEREHVAYSYDFPEPGPRVSMFEEALQVIDSLMTNERTNFDGDYYKFVDAPFEPKPLQKPRIPIIVGGSGPRMMRIAARYADNWNTRGTPEAVAPTIERFHAACAKEGRDLNTIRCSVFPWVHAFESEQQFADIVKAYMAFGFSDIAFPMPPEEFRPMMERCARDVLPELRRLS